MSEPRKTLTPEHRLREIGAPTYAGQIERDGRRIAELEREVARLREALEPFASAVSDTYESNRLPDACPVVADPSARSREVTVGDLRRARAALIRDNSKG